MKPRPVSGPTNLLFFDLINNHAPSLRDGLADEPSSRFSLSNRLYAVVSVVSFFLSFLAFFDPRIQSRVEIACFTRTSGHSRLVGGEEHHRRFTVGRRSEVLRY